MSFRAQGGEFLCMRRNAAQPEQGFAPRWFKTPAECLLG